MIYNLKKRITVIINNYRQAHGGLKYLLKFKKHLTWIKMTWGHCVHGSFSACKVVFFRILFIGFAVKFKAMMHLYASGHAGCSSLDKLFWAATVFVTVTALKLASEAGVSSNGRSRYLVIARNFFIPFIFCFLTLVKQRL